MKKLQVIFSVYLSLSVVGVSLSGQEDGVLEDSLSSKLVELEMVVSGGVARTIEFEERRSFPFRKKPVELLGELRLWNGIGVSIFYPEKEMLVIADEFGVLMRKFSKDGSHAQKNAGIGDSDTLSLLRAAFEFNREEIEALFDLEWRKDGEEWMIIMTPRDENEKKIVSVTLSGFFSKIGRITLKFAGKRSIEIRPTSEQAADAFSADEQLRFFRNRGE